MHERDYGDEHVERLATKLYMNHGWDPKKPGRIAFGHTKGELRMLLGITGSFADDHTIVWEADIKAELQRMEAEEM